LVVVGVPFGRSGGAPVSTGLAGGGRPAVGLTAAYPVTVHA
jgi:hypothetical protein